VHGQREGRLAQLDGDHQRGGPALADLSRLHLPELRHPAGDRAGVDADERLAAGDSPEQVREYFVARYGEWILLAPRRRGFNLLVWGFPIAAVVVGFVAVAFLLRRWTRRPAPAPPGIDAAMSERIRRELERSP
jgi:hypothetical protein